MTLILLETIELLIRYVNLLNIEKYTYHHIEIIDIS